MAAATCVFEDEAEVAQQTAKAPKTHKRTPSVGEFLRGRRNKENEPSKIRLRSPSRGAAERPLGERPINSPPQGRKIPVKDVSARPTMHKKSKSSMSFRSLSKEKDKALDPGCLSSSENATGDQDGHPKKSKSSTNLVDLLKKRSKKNLREEATKGLENVTPPNSAGGNDARSPVKTQFSAAPFEDQEDSKKCGGGGKNGLQHGTDPSTSKEAAQDRLLHERSGDQSPTLATRPSYPPFLQNRSSHGSMFKEELEAKDTAQGVLQSQPPWGGPIGRTPLLTPPSNHPQRPGMDEKRSSRIQTAIETLNSKSCPPPLTSPKKSSVSSQPLSEGEINAALESLLDARNIAPNMRNQMRALDTGMKLKLIQNQRGGSGSSTSSATPSTTDDNDRKVRSNDRSKTGEAECSAESRRSRSRPRSRAFTLNKRDESGSPVKKQKAEESTRSRSKSRPKSADLSSARPSSSRSLFSSTSINGLFSSSKPDAAAVPADFIHYMREVKKPELVDIGKIHKLRILLRNESIAWTDTFVTSGGMDEVVKLLYRIIQVEWREEHEDTLLHESLLCLKALCTTSLALQRLTEIEAEIFPKLLRMLFDEERKGPSEFGTRSVIISLLFAHLSAAIEVDENHLASRARTILGYLQDPRPDASKKPFDFIEKMHVNRPYRVWGKEVANVTKEVFWIFLHHLNVIPIVNTAEGHDGQNTTAPKGFTDRHFPPPRTPQPAAPYVGGVEWEATTYLATHLDLVNGLIASLPTRQERNALRQDMRNSGWEKVMGGTMRTCKEKFYAGVHDGLRVWVGAAKEDGWYVEDVRAGPPRDVGGSSPRKKVGEGFGGGGGAGSPVKKNLVELPPRIQLDIGFGDRDGGGVGLESGAMERGGGDAWI